MSYLVFQGLVAFEGPNSCLQNVLLDSSPLINFWGSGVAGFQEFHCFETGWKSKPGTAFHVLYQNLLKFLRTKVIKFDSATAVEYNSALICFAISTHSHVCRGSSRLMFNINVCLRFQ